MKKIKKIGGGGPWPRCPFHAPPLILPL